MKHTFHYNYYYPTFVLKLILPCLRWLCERVRLPELVHSA